MFTGFFVILCSVIGTVFAGVTLLFDTAASEQPRKWNFPVADIHGRTITRETFLDRVSVVSFSTQQSRAQDMRLGQEVGQRFGMKTAYQSVAIPNTSHVPSWAGFVARMKVAGAEKRAVREAVERQHALGNTEITAEKARDKIIFIHDEDGGVWKRMGLKPQPTASFVGVIDRTGTLVYLERAPIDKQKLFHLLKTEFSKEGSHSPARSAPPRRPPSTKDGTSPDQTKEE